jgi:FAD synthetase
MMTRVLVTGVFDILHPGHLYLFREAAKLGEVYVIVARDSTVLRFKKRMPIIPEQQRLEMVQSLKIVTYATLGNEGTQYMEKALELNPDIILLGPNQNLKITELQAQLKTNHRENIQVKQLTTFYDKCPLPSSSAIREKIIRNGANHNQVK